jgi:hypothetical protein
MTARRLGLRPGGIPAPNPKAPVSGSNAAGPPDWTRPAYGRKLAFGPGWLAGSAEVPFLIKAMNGTRA